MGGKAVQTEPKTGAFYVAFNFPGLPPPTPQEMLDNDPNYLVLYTDYDNLAIVAGDEGDMLWILSRHDSLEPQEWLFVINFLRKRNLPIDQLQGTEMPSKGFTPPNQS